MRLISLTANMITIGIHWSLPIAGTLLLTDLTLGLLARVAPQIHVFFLGLPLKIGLGLIVFSLALTILFPNLNNLFNEIGKKLLYLIGA